MLEVLWQDLLGKVVEVGDDDARTRRAEANEMLRLGVRDHPVELVDEATSQSLVCCRFFLVIQRTIFCASSVQAGWLFLCLGRRATRLSAGWCRSPIPWRLI